jgi:glucan 1,3-beta-glucosidase
MLVTFDGFSALLRALNLMQGFSKPIPYHRVFDNSTSPSPRLAAMSPDNIPGRLVGTAPIFASAATRDDSDACYSQMYDSTAAEQSFPPFVQDKADIYRYRQQQSVNMGSWYVAIIMRGYKYEGKLRLPAR